MLAQRKVPNGDCQRCVGVCQADGGNEWGFQSEGAVGAKSIGKLGPCVASSDLWTVLAILSRRPMYICLLGWFNYYSGRESGSHLKDQLKGEWLGERSLPGKCKTFSGPASANNHNMTLSESPSCRRLSSSRSTLIWQLVILTWFRGLFGNQVSL